VTVSLGCSSTSTRPPEQSRTRPYPFQGTGLIGRLQLVKRPDACHYVARGSLPGHPRPCRPPAESSRVDRPTSDGVGWLQQGGLGVAVALITVAAFWRQVVWTTWY
jgi:hypothetical protein